MLYVWGSNEKGQLGLPDVEQLYYPRPVHDPFVKDAKFVTRVCCGSEHTLVVVSGDDYLLTSNVCH